MNMNQPAAIIFATIAYCLAPVSSASAERATVDFGPFACLPDKKPVVVKEDNYIKMMLINVLNAPKKPWFTQGESTISTKLTFRPSAGQEWTYVRTIDKVGDAFMGIDQNLQISPRRLPLPRVIGGYQPTLTVSMVETDRDQAYKSLLDGLSKVAETIPNPATATASTVLTTVSNTYSSAFTAWMAMHALKIEANLGFSFDSDNERTCENLGTSTPLLGNVAYIILGTAQIGGHNINKDWARRHLQLDKDGSHLEFKDDVTFDGFLFNTTLKKGERFESTSYMLVRFETTQSEILVGDEAYNNEELRQQFAEARQAGDTELRKLKRRMLASNIQKSNLLNYTDTGLLLNAFDKYMTGAEQEWDIFWSTWAKTVTKDNVLKTLATLPDTTKLLASDEIKRSLDSALQPNGTLEKFSSTVTALGVKERIEVQKALVRAGLNPGPINGAVGATTEQALKDFQSSRNLGVNGIANIETLKALPGLPDLRF